MRVIRETFEFRTNGPMKYYDLTGLLRSVIVEHSVSEGLIHVHAVGATPGLVLLPGEHVDDFNDLLVRIIPVTGWRHGNAYAHLRSTLMGTHLVIGVYESQLWIPRGYHVYYVETRPVHNHRRRIHLFIISR